MRNNIYLRPHHGLCIRHFEGKGYSGEFTKHMSEVIASLSPDTLITVVSRTDEICGKCPNNHSGSCTESDKVSRFDEAVLELTGISAGETLTYREFSDKITGHIIRAGKFSAVCGDCGWAGICHSGE